MMQNNLTKVAVAALSLWAAGMLPANAAMSLTFSDGTHTASFSDSAVSGYIFGSSTTLGNWSISSSFIAYFSDLSDGPQLYFNSGALGITASSGNTTMLTITLTEQGVPGLSPDHLNMILDNLEGQASDTIGVTQTAKIGSTAVGGPYNVPASYPTTGTSSQQVPISSGLASSPFDFTEIMTLTGHGSATDVGQLNLVPFVAVPEPVATTAFAGIAALGMLLVPLRRKFSSVG